MKKFYAVFAMMITSVTAHHVQAAPFDCNKLKNIDLKEAANKIRPQDMVECQKRGWDIPLNLRESEGRKASVGPSSGSSALTGRQAPERSPGARGGGASVSQAGYNFSLKFPPSKGFPCSFPGVGSLICGGGSGGGSSGGNGNTTQNPFIDANHNGIPDAQEDLNGNGIPDGQEDLNKNGIPDGQEVKGATTDPDNTSGGCAAATNDDTTTDASGNTVRSWIYGEEKPLATASGINAPCGASLPLSIYNMSIAANVTHIFITEAGNHAGYLYARSGNSFTRVPSVNPLPAHFCLPKAKSSDPDQPNDTVTAPVAQVIAYNASDGYIPIRLQTDDSTDEFNPFDLEEPAVPGEPAVRPAKFFRAPLVSGVPQFPSGCPQQSTEPQYIQTTSLVTAPLTLITATTPSCDGELNSLNQPNTLFCSKFANTLNANGNACDAAVLYPTGASCTKKTAFVPLDRPNLAFPSGSNVSAIPMSDRTAHVATTVSGTRLYLQKNQLVLFGAKGGGFVLPEGGTMALASGKRLIMNAPAVVNAGARTVTLSTGGQVVAADGTVTQLPNNTSYTPDVSPPFAVQVTRSIEVYSGLNALTEPQPTVRFPVDTP